MATGTGKTYVASQVINKLWKAREKRRILFLADRNILIDQARNNDFKHFKGAMTKITSRKIDTSRALPTRTVRAGKFFLQNDIRLVSTAEQAKIILDNLVIKYYNTLVG